ncbi:ESPR domain-containing protein [Burkholderia mallei]
MNRSYRSIWNEALGAWVAADLPPSIGPMGF